MSRGQPARTGEHAPGRRRRLILAALVLGAAMAVLLVAVDDHQGPEGGSVPAAGETTAGKEGPDPLRRYRVRVLRTYPHDPSSFTQGLVFFRGIVFESTGLYGQSRVRSWELESGRVVQERELAPELFGEGLALVGDRLVQLTWRSGLAKIWDKETLEPLGGFEYAGEGWGLCFDGEELAMSDGSDLLVFRDPLDFRVRRSIRVTWEDRPVTLLNELECAEGWIYANILGQDTIARIDPATGEVTALVDASDLLPPAARRRADVLNGIAYRGETGTFLLTGKLWPQLFEVELDPL